MNRSELIEAISGHTGLTTKQSEAALAAVVYEITAGVRGGTPVRITGFGTFKLRQRAARKGRNPQTGAPVKVKASKGIGFTPGVGLKADLNSRTAVAKPGASKSVATKSAATKVAPAKKTPAKKAVATKAPSVTAAAKTAAAKAPAKRAVAKKVAPAKVAAAKKTVARSR